MPDAPGKPEEPDKPDCEPYKLPRVDFQRTYLLLPPDAGKDFAVAACNGLYPDKRWTVTASADDPAVRCGLTNVKIIAVNPEGWGGAGELRKFYVEHYGLDVDPGFEYEEWECPTPEALYQKITGNAPSIPKPPKPPVSHHVQFGVHLSADPPISAEERAALRQIKPELIKVLSFANFDDFSKVVSQHPLASYIIRLYVRFWDDGQGVGRVVTPEQFVRWTFDDTKKKIDRLKSAGVTDVMLELHNEPNLTEEGYGASWANGEEFATWGIDVLTRLRAVFPGVRFMYPGLSPGQSVVGVREDSQKFFADSIQFALECDDVGVHLYWSKYWPVSKSLLELWYVQNKLDDAGFPGFIYITESSNNKDGVSDAERGQEYVDFVNLLSSMNEAQSVVGVTFFVMSSQHGYAHETWLDKPDLISLVANRK